MILHLSIFVNEYRVVDRCFILSKVQKRASLNFDRKARFGTSNCGITIRSGIRIHTFLIIIIIYQLARIVCSTLIINLLMSCSSRNMNIMNVFLLISDNRTTSVYIFEDRIIHLDMSSMSVHLNEA